MHKNTVCILRLHIFKLELGLGLGLWSLMPLQLYYGGNQRKSPICRKSLKRFNFFLLNQGYRHFHQLLHTLLKLLICYYHCTDFEYNYDLI
jgi:hypothetical protein